jgi:hypothetical protein
MQIQTNTNTSREKASHVVDRTLSVIKAFHIENPRNLSQFRKWQLNLDRPYTSTRIRVKRQIRIHRLREKGTSSAFVVVWCVVFCQRRNRRFCIKVRGVNLGW